jgi:hypothetical protein
MMADGPSLHAVEVSLDDWRIAGADFVMRAPVAPCLTEAG